MWYCSHRFGRFDRSNRVLLRSPVRFGSPRYRLGPCWSVIGRCERKTLNPQYSHTGAFGHPAFLNEDQFWRIKSEYPLAGREQPMSKLILGAQSHSYCPVRARSFPWLLLAGRVDEVLGQLAEIDHTFPLESRRRAEDILVEGKKTYFIQVFSSVAHGFAMRGDPNIPIASEHDRGCVVERHADC